MTEYDLKKQVQEGYQTMNNRWLRIHYRLLFYCTAVSGIMEILMFFIIRHFDALNCSEGEYWLKYILVPVGLNACIVCIGRLVLNTEKVSMTVKQYAVSSLFVGFAFVLELMHSGFVAVLVVGIFPILMTVMYEAQKLTAIVAFFTVITQTISGYCIFWDPKKQVNNDYTINMLILLCATFCTWLACKFMIDFVKMKRKIIITNDMERFRLQRDINMDGLTGVGNKLSLLARLGTTSVDCKDIAFLAMLDLDHFKLINDTYGHIFGDDVLWCMGDALRCMQGGSEAYRYGGDEFCVVFTNKSREDAIGEIKKVQDYLTEHIKMPDDRMNIFVSVGVACYAPEKTAPMLLQQADEALYKAKKRSPNEIVVYGDPS